MLPALALIVVAALWRLLAVQIPALSNFAPLMALTFCGGVYFSDRRLWAAPFLALTLSDLYLDFHYASAFGETWAWPSILIRLACFAAALPLGRFVARRRNLLTLLAGSLAASLLFYFITNTDAWLRDPHYVKTAAGWWQAMTIGRPEFPPTLFFFRNTLLSDLGFTALFAAVMELSVRSTSPGVAPARR
jgi:hypothetical protein